MYVGVVSVSDDDEYETMQLRKLLVGQRVPQHGSESSPVDIVPSPLFLSRGQTSSPAPGLVQQLYLEQLELA